MPSVNVAAKSSAEEDVHMLEMMKLNDEWNKQTQLTREARQTEEELNKSRAHASALHASEEALAQEKEISRKLFSLEKEEAQHFISLDRLDEEIETALNSRAVYNFVLDAEGNIYREIGDGELAVDAEYSRDTQDKRKEYLKAQRDQQQAKEEIRLSVPQKSTMSSQVGGLFENVYKN